MDANLKLTGSSEEVKLKKEITKLYDESAEVWENVWGDHVHHGFYEPNVPASNRDAQIRLIEEALKFGQITDDPLKKPKNIVDIGCGFGGSARYLAKKFGSKICGINLSPVQVQRARALTPDELKDKVSYEVADALDQPFPDGQFDLVWCIETAELMPDKIKCISEMARVAAPGATIIITTGCHRDLAPGEETLKPDEKILANKMVSAFCLAELCPVSEYVKIAQSLGLQDIKTADWSDNIYPYLIAVRDSALTWKGIFYVLRGGWKTIKGAMATKVMIDGYEKKIFKYAAITCRKPQ